MKTLLVSLVSDQTLPNVQLIKELKNEVSHYLFITTDKMEKKGCRKWIEKASKVDLNQTLPFKKVKEFSFEDISKQLDEIDFSFFDKIIVNLTGGTKIITLSSHEYFKQLGADIYYVTGKDNEYIKIFPGRNKLIKTFQEKITINDYLLAYGFDAKPSEPSGVSPEFTNSLFTKYCKNNFFDYYEALNLLRRKRNSGIKNISKSAEEIRGFLSYLNFITKEENVLNSLEVKYLTGEWLEEYVGNKIQQELDLTDEEIKIGVVLNKDTPSHQVNSVTSLIGTEKNKKPDNEIDVMFTYKNKFYTIECKTSIINLIETGKDQNGEKKIKEENILGQTIYKADYLKSKFGLFAQSEILTLTDFIEYVNMPKSEGERNNRKSNMEDLINRCNLSNIKLIDKKMILNSSSISSLIL